MKFTAIIFPLLVTGAVSHVVQLRDVSTIRQAVSDVGHDVEGLDQAIRAFSGNDDSIQAATSKLAQTISDSQTIVDASDNLTLSDSMSVQQSMELLRTQFETLAADLKEKAPALQEKSLCEVTRRQLIQYISKMLSFSRVVAIKYPAEARDAAQDMLRTLRATVSTIQTAVDTSNCNDEQS
ncbi:hypothetical protein PT974_05385 [Cladobotryum mycophilum]|uniref:Cell wall galactomannoprotein n=1 Tax=Cladobotryum mycophilum TaxID=491253 RepID=A0ABR0SII2_9HYPO